MSWIITIFTLGLQTAMTFIATFCIYMIFALLDNDFGIDGLFGFIFIQPIIAIFISGITILVCLVAGLPIRFNKKLNYWWTTNFYISIIGALTGLTLLMLAIVPDLSETVSAEINGQEISTKVPNSTLSITGWLLTAFFTLHIFPPRPLTEKIKTIFQKIIIRS